MNNEKITRKSFLHKIGLGALAVSAVSAGGILLPETVKAGVADNLNNGALAKQVNTNTKAISTLNNNLTANDGTNNVPFYFDYQDGQYGYNTSSTRGADTFSPFKSGFSTMEDYTLLLSPYGNTVSYTPLKDYDGYLVGLICAMGITQSWPENATLTFTGIEIIETLWDFRVSGQTSDAHLYILHIKMYKNVTITATATGTGWPWSKIYFETSKL